ncbi:MAG TPA: argininosuccinate lyase [Candidatus Latescibacteria bacterium]|nr:argininosuccinate lyase [Candidatus Latescibacterota bacterium]
MAKLWEKGYELDEEMEAFTVEEDYLLDRKLVEADVLGSIAHAKMLSEAGILTEGEFRRLKEGLVEVLELHRRGEFEVRREQEDVHTAVEEFLTERLGDVGKKLHTARSRNDQVLVDIRLYTRDRLLEVMDEVLNTSEVLLAFAKAHRDVPMPGRTHTQRAMPSSVALWAGAFAEALLDDLSLLWAAYRLNDQNPLGSAASYGVPLPIDRERTAELLGFRRVQHNVLYANNSRGKVEAVVVFALSQVGEDLAKLSNDLIWFSTPEFGYFTLPEEYCPGSSIMPQKRNPGPLELVRAKSARIAARAFQLLLILRNLPSGYNRDLQETKGPLMEAVDTAVGCLRAVRKIFANLEVDREALVASFSPELFAADEALHLAAEGVPFREAYRRVAARLGELEARDPVESIHRRTHTGAPGDPELLEVPRRWLERERRRLEGERNRMAEVKERLLGL